MSLISRRGEVKIEYNRYTDSAHFISVLSGSRTELPVLLDSIDFQRKGLFYKASIIHSPHPRLLKWITKPKTLHPRADLGVIDVKGYTPAVLCLDAALKNTNVKVVGFYFNYEKMTGIIFLSGKIYMIEDYFAKLRDDHNVDIIDSTIMAKSDQIDQMIYY